MTLFLTFTAAAMLLGLFWITSWWDESSKLRASRRKGGLLVAFLLSMSVLVILALTALLDPNLDWGDSSEADGPNGPSLSASPASRPS